MTLRRFALEVLTVAALISFVPRIAGASDQPLVVVLETTAQGVTHSDVAGLSDLIAQTARRQTFAIARDADVRRALSRHASRERPCADDSSCQRAVGRELHAELIITSGLSHTPSGYLLKVKALRVAGSDEPIEGSESLTWLVGIEQKLKTLVTRVLDQSTGGLSDHALPATPRMVDLSATQSSPPVSSRRVVVLGPSIRETSAADMETFRDLVAQKARKQGPTDLVNEEDVRKAAGELASSETTCAEEQPCRLKVGRALHARLVVTGVLMKRNRGYLLEMQILDVDDPKSPAQTSETMKRLSNVGLNLHICIERLFDQLPGAHDSPEPSRVDAISPPPVMVVPRIHDDSPERAPPAPRAVGAVSISADTGAVPGQDPRLREGLRLATSVPAETASTRREAPWYAQWWVWTAVGATAVVATTVGVLVSRPAPKAGNGTVVLSF